MEYYSATKSNGIRLFIEMWLDLETVIQNEVSQKEKNKQISCINAYICNLAEKATATHSSILAWKIPWMEEPGRLQSMGLLRVGHD